MVEFLFSYARKLKKKSLTKKLKFSVLGQLSDIAHPFSGAWEFTECQVVLRNP